MDFSNFVSFYTGLLNFYLFFKMNFSTFISFQAGWQGLLLLCLQEIQVQQRWPIGKTPVREKVGLPKKKRDFLGIFPKGGGRVFSNPKTFVNLPSVFLYAKIILRCQNMFYNSGEVISDQFHHITLDSKSGKFWKKSAKTRSFGNFFHCEGGGGHLFPKVYVRIVTKKWTFWWRPKMLQRT